MDAYVPPILIKEEIIDDLNWKVNDRELGLIWRYSLWEYQDTNGNIIQVEKSDGCLNLYFCSIPLVGDERLLMDESTT